MLMGFINQPIYNQGFCYTPPSFDRQWWGTNFGSNLQKYFGPSISGVGITKIHKVCWIMRIGIVAIVMEFS